ncbi:MFS transporter [Pseudomonas plecoglossicida]|nr:MFS transporter [Pseudomonas plecoglossicida]
MAFWLARVFTASGFQMLTVAIGWHLYQLTGNVLDLGLVGLVEFAPRVLFMLHTGHVADRYDRRKVAALCQTLQGLIALALALGSATDNVSRELIFALAFLLGAARSFEMPAGLGLLRSAPAVGALLMSLWLARFPVERKVGRTMFTAVGVFGVATIAFGLSTSFWFSLAVLVVLGAADMISMVIRGAFVQLETPDEMRGRVSAVNGLFIGASNQLGEFESGVTAHWFGTVPAVVLGGVGTLVVTGVWIKLFPSLARRDRLHSS